MKNEKHVALAKSILDNTRCYNNPKTGYQDLINEVAAALSQVERDALASKVVGPTQESLCESFEIDLKGEPLPKYDLGVLHGFRFYRDNLALAPSEQVIRVPSDDSIRKMAKEIAAPYEASYEKGAAREALFYMRNAIKRLNPTCRIEESNE